jgi:hypothetical protein
MSAPADKPAGRKNQRNHEIIVISGPPEDQPAGRKNHGNHEISAIMVESGIK